MSFQAYLDAVEKKTGRTPQEIVDEAHAKGFGADTKSGEIVDWLAEAYGLGRGPRDGDGPRRRRTARASPTPTCGDHRRAPRRVERPAPRRPREPRLPPDLTRPHPSSAVSAEVVAPAATSALTATEFDQAVLTGVGRRRRG